MHDVRFREYLEGLQQILEVLDGLGLFEATVQFDFLFEGASVAELIDEVVVVGSFKNFNEANHMRGVFYLRQSLNFVDGELLQLRAHLELFDFNDLDSHQLASLFVESFVNLPEFSLADHCLQNVVFYFFAHRQSLIINIKPSLKTGQQKIICIDSNTINQPITMIGLLVFLILHYIFL